MNLRRRRQMLGDVAWMIRRSGQQATILRPRIAGEGSFFGSHESHEEGIAEIPVEMKVLPPKDLAEIGADAAASVLPDSGVLESDILEIDGIRYRVTEVKPQNVFGALTHLDLHLELEKREASDA